MKQKTWQFDPPRPKSPRVNSEYKSLLLSQVEGFLDWELKPRTINPPPSSLEFNYIVDLFGKWHGRYLYFCSKYASPGPYAISPFFDSPFARLEYVAENCFNISYCRHNGQWVQLDSMLSFTDCLSTILGEPLLLP